MSNTYTIQYYGDELLARTFVVPIGEALTFTVQIYNADETARDCSGGTVSFNFERQNAAHITIPVDGEANGIHTITLDSLTTLLLDGKYTCDFWYVPAEGSTPEKLITNSLLILTPVVGFSGSYIPSTAIEIEIENAKNEAIAISNTNSIIIADGYADAAINTAALDATEKANAAIATAAADATTKDNIVISIADGYADTAYTNAVNQAMIIDGVSPEQAIDVSDLSFSSWWTGLTGLTTLKYVDARYSGQSAGVIAAWDDLSGNQDLVQVIAAQNPELVTSGFIGDGGQYVKFLPATPTTPKLLSGDDVTAGLTIPCTLAIVCRHYNTDNSIKTIADLSNGGVFRWTVSDNASSATIQNNQGGPVVTQTNSNARISSTRVNLHAVVVDGANSYLWDNGIKKTVNLTISGTWEPTTAQMGAQGTTLNGFYGEMRAGIMLEGAATQAQLETIFANLCGQVPTNLVQVGDSLTSTSLTTQTADLLNEYTWCDSDAVAGSTVHEMFARFNTNITPKYNSAMRNVIVLWGGTNDIADDGYTGIQTASKYWEYCDYARRAGWRVIAVTLLPRGSLSETQNGYREDFNDELLQHWRSHCDSIIFAHKITGLVNYNTTYWNTNQFELNDAGYELIAKAINANVRKLCES